MQEDLEAAYQRDAQDRAQQEEMALWDTVAGDGIEWSEEWTSGEERRCTLSAEGHQSAGVLPGAIEERLEREEEAAERSWARLSATTFTRDWNSAEDSVYDRQGRREAPSLSGS